MSSAEPNEPKSPAILERELPLERLRAALADAQSGSGRLVLVGGEAGVGKTALVRCFCEERRGSTRVLWGACDALFTPRPLGPFLDVASAIGGRFAHILEGEARPHDVSVAMMEELTARPTILVLEDLHGADEATLDVLELLGRRIRPSSALVVATYRNDELAPTHPLRIVLGELATQDAVMRISVERLSREAVTELAMPYDVDPEELYRATDGNPFFATEVLAAAGQEMPQTILHEGNRGARHRPAADIPCLRSRDRRVPRDREARPRGRVQGRALPDRPPEPEIHRPTPDPRAPVLRLLSLRQPLLADGSARWAPGKGEDARRASAHT